LNAVEDLTESLANALLGLSVVTRRRDLVEIGRYLGDGLEATPFPTRPGRLSKEVKWILKHAWEAAPSTDPVGKEEFLAQIDAFLQHFSEIDDARFKVKRARFEDRPTKSGEARVFFFVVGRDLEGRREWVRGQFDVTAVRDADDAWKIVRWRTLALDSDVVPIDLFSEISGPAGVARTIPAFGIAPNNGLVAHGGAVGDLNGDDLVDLVVTEIDGSRLYLNDGRGGFRDASEETLVRYTPPVTAVLILDHDGDGDSDIFLSATGEQVLLENRLRPDGKLQFFDVSEEAGVAVHAVGFSAAAADVNGDALTDIYVASYNRYGAVMPNSWSRATNGTSNLLFINEGSGHFREAAADWGVKDARWSYAATFADIDNDGHQDLYVANDFGENALFMNQGDRFRDEAAERGVLDPGNGMGAAFGDFDNDGDLDLHVTNMSSTAGNRRSLLRGTRCTRTSATDRSATPRSAPAISLPVGPSEGASSTSTTTAWRTSSASMGSSPATQ
jgi:hypothetical protein